MSSSAGAAGRERVAREVAERLGVPPPGALLDIWTGVVPAGDRISVFGPDEIAALNADYRIADFRPDLLLIAADGDLGLFVPRGEADPRVRLIDVGAVGSDDGTDAGRLADLAADGFRSLPGVDEGTPGATAPVDVLVTGRPEAGTRALYEIRRVLGSTVPVGELTGPAAAYPVTVLRGVPYQRYRDRIDDLAARYGCLEVRASAG